MASIADWNNAQRRAWRDSGRNSYGNDYGLAVKTVELVVCTHGVRRNGEDVTLIIYRIHLSCPPRWQHGFQFEEATLSLTFKSQTETEPPKLLAWAPFKRPKRVVTGDSDVTSESNVSKLLGGKAINTAEPKLGNE
jgi:hypothetical protein